MNATDTYLKSEIDKARAAQINAEMLEALKAMKKAFGNCGASPFEQAAMDRMEAAIANATR